MGIGAYAYIYFFPRIFYNALERAIVQHGIRAINTLYAKSKPAPPSTLKSNLLESTNHDTLCAIGSLDLSKEPEILHVPDMADRYYSKEFVDPWENVFPQVGGRTTGTQAGDYLIS